MHKRGLVLLLLLFCIPIVYAASIPDCTITLGSSCVAGYQAMGKVTSQGHFRGLSSTYAASSPYTLCCSDSLVYNLPGSAVSFNYVPESGHVSVDSLITTFPGTVKLGFPAKCTVKNACAVGTEEVCIFKVSNADNSHIVDCNNAGVPVTSSNFKEVCCTYVAGIKFPVTYNGNGFTGGSVPVDGNSPYLAGETVDVLPQGDLVNTGYDFLGWNTFNVDGSSQDYTGNSQFTMPANAVVLTAIWTNQPTYILTYDANGSSGTPPAPELKLGGEQVNVAYPYDLVPPPGKSLFTGWYGLGIMIYFGGSPFNMPTNDLTLYAQWGNPEDCTNGKDDDGDKYIDCADEDCKTIGDATKPPQECTGSPIVSSACIISYTHNSSGSVFPVYNSTCLGQSPNPLGNPNFFCSYGKDEDLTQGVCCQVGTYAVNDPMLGWSCVGSEKCGLDPTTEDCIYDFDYTTNQWMNSVYTAPGNKWCVSKFPNYYNPDTFDESSTGCCLMVQHGEVGYYTAPGNVKIFGTSS